MIRNRNMIFRTATNSGPDADKYIELPKIAAANQATASTTINGAMFYDSTNNILKVCINGSWATVQYSL